MTQSSRSKKLKTMTKLILCFALLTCMSCSKPPVEHYYGYRHLSPGNAGAVVTIDADRLTISVTDLGASLEICPPAHEFICFNSDLLSFAVPRDLSENSAPWSYSGTEYRVLSHRDERILGQFVSLFIIGANLEGSDLVFYFSKHRGLIALGPAGETGTPLFGIDYCGFGAEISCRTPVQ